MKTLIFSFIFIFTFTLFSQTHSQQPYINNKQNACYTNDSTTNGFLCTATPQPRCLSYLTFRAHPPYNTPVQIGYILNSSPAAISAFNNITDVATIPTDTLIIVPLPNCTCTGKYTQHNSSYVMKYTSETYFTVANNTYQGLTTCQAMMEQNPNYDSRNLLVGNTISVPIRCACPSRNQSSQGVRFLLSYLVDWGDSIDSISQSFGVDKESVLAANELSATDLIFPFTIILVPLRSEPSYNPEPTPSPPVQPPTISVPADDDSNGNSSSSSSKKWVFVGVGVGLFLLLVVFLGLLFWYLRGRKSTAQSKKFSTSTDYAPPPANKPESFAVSSEDVRFLIDSSLNVYNFGELQTATKDFSYDNVIRGSVYRGVINGDEAAIKKMKGNALNEMSVLKQISHSSVVRLSGYCMHEGNTYLVYEFAENGSLSDWLHESKVCETDVSTLGWKERVQIAYDVADGLNYLHNYANPPYIHSDLRSSNILLTSNFRAKIANFGMARTLGNEEGDEQDLHLTKHIVGTQGYMAPEFIENGVVTPKLDVFAFGVVMLELLSGKEATTYVKTGDKELLLFAAINQVLEGDNVREKLKGFIDPTLRSEYPLELAFSMAQLAKNCVAQDLNSRLTMFDVYVSLSKILSSSLDWDPSDEQLRV